MAEALDRALAQIESAALAELRALFAARFGSEPADRVSADWLRGNLAWAAQVAATGKDPAHYRAKLKVRLEKRRGRGGDTVASGTRLFRAWGGETHEVTVLERGYAWQGRRYRSLSAIATEITGTRWSGPRFFGMRAGP